MSRVLAQARFDFGNLLRNGEQTMVSILLPVVILIGLTSTPVLDGDRAQRIAYAGPGVLGLAVLSSAFTGAAISTGFDRRYGVLRALGLTPLGRGGLLAGRMLATLGVVLLQTVVLTAVAVGIGWRPDLSGIPYAVVFLVLGTGTFVALALLMAGTIRAEATLALANVVWVLLLVLGGVVVPPDQMPRIVGAVAGWLPSGALGEGLRAACLDGRMDSVAAGVLCLWGLAAAACVRRVFRWSD